MVCLSSGLSTFPARVLKVVELIDHHHESDRESIAEPFNVVVKESGWEGALETILAYQVDREQYEEQQEGSQPELPG